jgi:hypothetical protein
MTIITSRFIADHPRPFMETAMPQFHFYANVPQNIPRPTWKGLYGFPVATLRRHAAQHREMKQRGIKGLGDLVFFDTNHPVETMFRVGTVLSLPLLTYHGYKRTNSLGWALAWGLLGTIVWPITVPVAFAQGFAERKKGK